MTTGRNSLVASRLLATGSSTYSVCKACCASRLLAATSAPPAVSPAFSGTPLSAHRGSRIFGTNRVFPPGLRQKHKNASEAGPDELPSPAAAFHQSLDEVLQSEFQFTPEGRMTRRHRRLVDMTLEDFEHFRPKQQRGHHRNLGHLAPHQRAAQREKQLWDSTYQRIWSSLTLDQLKTLASEAKLALRPPSSGKTVRKGVYVSELMKSQFGLVDPEERSQAMTRVERVEKHFPLSRIQLYLLLSDGGRPLNRIASQTGTRLRPDLSMEDGGMQFGVVVHGTKAAVERTVQAALDGFSQSIISMKYKMQVPLAVLTPRAISAVSSTTQCAVQAMLPEQGAQGQVNEGAPATLELHALHEANLSAAQVKLASLQADLHHAPRPLVSMATHSPLDPDYDDEAKSLDLAQYAFLPHICPPPVSWITESMTGGDSASVFRLQRIMENATWGATATGEDEPMTLVDVESPNAPLGGDRNWAWLHERLDPALLPDEKLTSLSNDASETLASHAVEFGSLVFSSEPGEADKSSENPIAAELIRLLKAPLTDSWPLDTAYEWLRKRDRSQSNLLLSSSASRRPYWVESSLHGLPVDGQGEFENPALSNLVGDASGSSVEESETIRLVYRASGAEGSNIEAIERTPLRLHLEVEEVRVEVTPDSETTDGSDIDSVAQGTTDATDVDGSIIKDDSELVPDADAPSEDTESAASPDSDPSDSPNPMSPQRLSLDDLIGNTNFDEEHTEAPVAAPEMKLKYRLKSAYWATAQETDVLAPEFSRDLRLTTAKTVPCQPEALLDACPDLADYLAKLDAFVDVVEADLDADAEGNEREADRRKSHKSLSLAQQQDPRQALVPLPLLTKRTPVPPLRMDLPAASGKDSTAQTLHLEKVERVARTRWPLPLPVSQASPHSSPDSESAADLGDSSSVEEPLVNGASSSSSSSPSAAPPHYGHIVSETIVSDSYRQTPDSYGLGVVAKTVTKVEWTGELESPSEAEAKDGAEGRPAQPWRVRLDQVQALLRAGARLQPRKEPASAIGGLFERAAATEGDSTQTKQEAREARESNPLGPWMPSVAAQSGVAGGASDGLDLAGEDEGEEVDGLLKPSFRKN